MFGGRKSQRRSAHKTHRKSAHKSHRKTAHKKSRRSHRGGECSAIGTNNGDLCWTY